MPPQGLLLIAAYMPESWPVRFIDENIAPATAADLAWADVVLVSGMHIQAPQIHDIHRRAKAAGKVMVLGGPSVSASPEMYPDFDYLHIGEIGDAHRRAHRCASTRASRRRPPQLRFQTKERLPLRDFPIPAYDSIPLAALSDGHAAILQRLPVSVRVLRHPGPLRPPAAAEDAAADHRRTRRHVQRRPAIRRWSISSTTISSAIARRRARCCRIWSHGRSSTAIPMQFACEATLNIAKQTEILRLMREASFLGMFVGIETPEADALNAMRKEHNNARADDGVRSRRSTATAWKSRPASSSGSIPTRADTERG